MVKIKSQISKLSESKINSENKVHLSCSIDLYRNPNAGNLMITEPNMNDLTSMLNRAQSLTAKYTFEEKIRFVIDINDNSLDSSWCKISSFKITENRLKLQCSQGNILEVNRKNGSIDFITPPLGYAKYKNGACKKSQGF